MHCAHTRGMGIFLGGGVGFHMALLAERHGAYGVGGTMGAASRALRRGVFFVPSLLPAVALSPEKCTVLRSYACEGEETPGEEAERLLQHARA